MTERWETLLQEAKTAAKSARGVYETAERAGRDLHPEEVARFEKHSKEAFAKKDESDRAKADLSTMNAVRALTSAEEDEARIAGKTAHGEALPLPSELTEDDRKSLFRSVASGTSGRVSVKDSTTLTNLEGGVVTDYIGGDYLDDRRLVSLFASRAAPGPTVRVYRTKTLASAGTVAEGERKPDAGLEVEPIDLDMQKLATTIKITDELAEDYAEFVSFVKNELTNAMIQTENTVLRDALLGSGLAEQDSAGDDGIDATADAIATLRSAGVTAGAAVMSPARLAKLRKAKTDDGHYLVPPTDGGPAQLHGLPVVVLPDLADDTVLCGDFRGAAYLWVRSPLTVDAHRTEDDFMVNKSTLRAEERLALGVHSPKRILNIDLASTN
jgi:HK97 family phage major capsid protein